ncbi:hypothetical protein [Stenotrophomonas maltophilia]|uniref:hypothetical protein n=1 Tax=Stenotrophomonas maltophilia TaxID=40324 RepID=UPI0016608AD5|nr:hypothetical protein [Stenotrophomonas maltophilia]
MKIQEISRTSILAGLCFIAADFADATPLGTAREAQVILVDGIPAICLPSKSKTSFAVGRLMIQESRAPGGTWAIVLAAGAKPLTLMPGDCMSYGKVPNGYVPVSARESALIPTLSLNRTYIFSMDTARTVESVLQTRFYSTVFCIKTGGSGTFAVHKEQACVSDH